MHARLFSINPVRVRMSFNWRGRSSNPAAGGRSFVSHSISIYSRESHLHPQVKSQISEPSLRFALYEPVEFIRHFLVDKLEWKKVRDQVAIHVPCSSKKMGIEESFAKLAGLCANEVRGLLRHAVGQRGGHRRWGVAGSKLQHPCPWKLRPLAVPMVRGP